MKADGRSVKTVMAVKVVGARPPMVSLSGLYD